jgi:hypothetical protein
LRQDDLSAIVAKGAPVIWVSGGGAAFRLELNRERHPEHCLVEINLIVSSLRHRSN